MKTHKHLILTLFFLLNVMTGVNLHISAQIKENTLDSLKLSFEDKNPLNLIQIGDADLAVRYMKGEGIPIVFVHGSWDDHNSWMPVTKLLSTKIKNPIVLYDRRGHSASSPDLSQGTISQDVNDIVLLTEKLGIRKAHFVGHSYGANILVKLASENAEIAESFVLFEPPLFGLLKDKIECKAELGEVKEAMVTAKGLLEKGLIQKGTIQFIENVAFGKNSWNEVFDERAKNTMMSNYRTWLDQSNDSERLKILPEKLNNFRGRITFIVGANSIPIYPCIAKELKKIVLSVEVKTISDAGHGGLISHSAETTNIILEHLNNQ